MKTCTAIALSGGVDSLVAAALLKSNGHPLLGIHFLTGYENTEPLDASLSKPDPRIHAREVARRKLTPLALKLDIPLHIIDLHEDFNRIVVDYFVRTYRQGRTPNPCLVCNPLIKFDIMFKRARALGAGRLATGHYARTDEAPDGRRRLWRGKDKTKDQSYFLSRLNQEQLAVAVFPLAGLTKSETRQLAAARGLTPVSKDESQDICFIRNAHYGEFLARQPGFTSQPGPIENVDGRVIGRHQGLHKFTVGQRRGINRPAERPYYVVRIEPRRNCLVVGFKEHLLTGCCRVTDINWIAPPPGEPLELWVRIRYRHAAVRATLTPNGPTSADVRFAQPEPAITPGQGAVFYLGDEVLGGGWIQ